jgi:hypothetical protein
MPANDGWMDDLDRIATAHGLQRQTAGPDAVKYVHVDGGLGAVTSVTHEIKKANDRFVVTTVQEVYHPPAGIHDVSRFHPREYQSLEAVLADFFQQKT